MRIPEFMEELVNINVTDELLNSPYNMISNAT